MDSERNRVFVTGLGIISPQGLDASSSWDGIKSGVSGVDAPETIYMLWSMSCPG